MLVTLAAGCVPAASAPEPTASVEPLKRSVPQPTKATTLPKRTPNPGERVDNVAPHLFRDDNQLYITFFFNARTGEQVFFKGAEFKLNYKLTAPDGKTPLVDKDVVMTADEQRFVVSMPEMAKVEDQLKCKYAAGLPDGRRLNGETLLTIAPDRDATGTPEGGAP
jgi:hypothetical protein